MATILCVEDDIDMQQMLGFLLKQAGFKVIVAGYGKAGIEKANKAKPDLILMDIMMPDISGIQAIKRIKANPASQHIPIIVLSAYASPKLKQEALEAGAIAFLVKNIEPAGLVNAIKQNLVSI